jgi:uncharacterized alkaline shock family protein YloU
MNGELGAISVSDSVFTSLAARAALSVDGITKFGTTFSEMVINLVKRNGRRGIDVEIGTTEIALDMRLVIEHGRNIPEVARKAQEAVKKEIEHWTGFSVVEINLSFVDVSFTTPVAELSRLK